MQDLAGMRLDVACVELGIAPTRNKASALIQKGKVCVNGNVILPRFSEEFRYHILMVNFLSFESIILSGTACFTASTTSFKIFSLT